MRVMPQYRILRRSRRVHQRHFKRGIVAGAGVDGDGGRLIVGGLGFHDVGHEGLRVAVIEREPGALDFDHHRVAGLEDVINIVQREFVFVHGTGRKRGGMVEAR